MANNTDHVTDAPVVDGKSIAKASNPISKATLIGLAAGVLFLIIAGVIITKFFNAPTGNTGGTDSPNGATRVNQ